MIMTMCDWRQNVIVTATKCDRTMFDHEKDESLYTYSQVNIDI